MVHRKIARTACFVCLVSLVGISNEVLAGVVPFRETFDNDSANWYDSTGLAPTAWTPAGGPDGSPFATTILDFSNLQAGDTVALFRAHDEFHSSNGAFVGDWLSSAITGFAANIQHDGNVPLHFFVRFAGPNNFPGANNVFFIPVVGGTWTELTAVLPNPSLIFEGPFTYGQVFGNIGHVQIGVSVPASLAGTSTVVQFGLDNVSLVPEPASALLLGMGAVALLRRRKSWRSQSS